MQEFGKSSSIVMVYDHLHVHYVYIWLCLRILLYHIALAKYEPQQNTPKTNELPSEFSHFWRSVGPLQKRGNQAAFQKLSEAFEQLQPAASHPATGEKNKRRKREKPWWDVPTWEEMWVGVKCVGQ